MSNVLNREFMSGGRQAFQHYLRTGQRFTSAEWEHRAERKFNPNHDPEDGRFAFALLGSGSSDAIIASGSERPKAASEAKPKPDPSMVQHRAASTPPIAIKTVVKGSGEKADEFASALKEAMETNGIEQPEQQAAFLAQVAVESRNLQATEENLNYSAERLVQVWPNRFPSVESAKPYAGNPAALANKVYANRMGNGDEASGDGYQYRGRGLMQITGRANYRALGYEENPDALALPKAAAASVAAFWRNSGLHKLTRIELSRRQFDAISRRVNGGNHGSGERWAAYQRALAILRPRKRV